jgi:hypothetical protein
MVVIFLIKEAHFYVGWLRIIPRCASRGLVRTLGTFDEGWHTVIEPVESMPPSAYRSCSHEEAFAACQIQPRGKDTRIESGAGAFPSPYQRKDKGMKLHSLIRVVYFIAAGILGLIVFRETMKSGQRWKEEGEASRKEE